MTPEERKEKKKEHNRKYREKQREMQQAQREEQRQEQPMQEVQPKREEIVVTVNEDNEYEEYTQEQLEEIINMRANQIANEKIKALNSKKVAPEEPKTSFWSNQFLQSVGSSVAQTAGALLIPLTIRAIHGRLSSSGSKNTGTSGISAQPSQLSNIQTGFSLPSF